MYVLIILKLKEKQTITVCHKMRILLKNMLLEIIDNIAKIW